jgi:parallel beta helix pectate lyase-like protein
MYKKILLAVISFSFPFIFYGQKVIASSYGFNGNDNSKVLYEAIKNNDTIIIDTQDIDWIISPLKMRNLEDKTIIFDKEIVLKAKSGAFLKSTDALIKFINCKNIKIYGNDSLLIMNKHEYIDGEWRMGISLLGCEDVLIKDITVSSSGGDGVYIDGYEKGTFSENITLENIIAINNKRQGISIISAKNVLVKNSTFTETKGTLPGAGVDIEPDDEYDVISNIIFENCVFTNNNHAGIVIALGKLNAQSLPVSISFNNCYLSMNHHKDNRYAAAEISISADPISPVLGNVEFNDIFIDGSNWGILYSRKSSMGFHVFFNNINALNICKQKDNISAIYLEVPDYYKISGPIGGFSFNNMFIKYNAKSSFMTIKGSSLRTLRGVENITGDITIFNPNLIEIIDYIKYSSYSNKNFDINFTVLNSD